MEGFSFLIALAAFVLAIMALHKLSKLETRIAQLKSQLQERATPPAAGAAALAEVAEEAAPDVAGVDLPEAEALPALEAVEAVAEAATETERLPETAPAATPGRDMEQQLASRWFVWIGGVAIAVGGLLFVKYAYDQGLISPTLQVLLGLLAGAVLIALGEVVRRKASASVQRQADYVPAALSAAGLAVLFASIYAAYALYELIGGFPTFLGLAAVALGALALSRWQGPLIAALGLLGSYITPALIPSADPNAWGFFTYLLVIAAACFGVLRGRNWWWLGYAAVAGAAAWTLLWINAPVFAASDILPVGSFAILLGLLGFFGLGGLGQLRDGGGSLLDPPGLGEALKIGLFGLAAMMVLLAALAIEVRHDGIALLLLSLGALVLVFLAWARNGLSPLAPVAGLILLAVLVAWPEVAFHELAFDERGFWTSVPGPGASAYLRWMLAAAAATAILGLAGSLRRSPCAWWAALAGGGSTLFVGLAWARVDLLLGDGIWSMIALGLAVPLLIVATVLGRVAVVRQADLAAGLLAAAAAALLLFLLDRLFDGVWLTLAIAGLAAAFAAAARHLRARLTGPIVAALASLASLRLFLSRELWLDDRALPLGQHWVTYGYGVPAVLFLLASRFLRRAGYARSAVALEGLSLGLAISLLSLEIRVLIGGGYLYDEPQFLEMSAHILTWLGAAYGLMHRQRLFSSFVSLWGSRALIAGSVAAILLLSLLDFNPAVTEAPVPGGLLFNALLLGYLAPAILIGLIALRLDAIGWDKLKPAAGALALILTFAYLTLQTKRIYQGPIMQLPSLSPAESYSYSAVWLAFALALFVAGIKLGRQFVRLAGLAVLALVVVKVFVYDMSNLEGLFRIASLVGLGLCLVGIGWLYQRFVQPRRGTAP